MCASDREVAVHAEVNAPGLKCRSATEPDLRGLSVPRRWLSLSAAQTHSASAPLPVRSSFAAPPPLR